MKCVVNWIPLRIRVRSRNTQPHLNSPVIGLGLPTQRKKERKHWQAHHDRHLTYLKLYIDLFSCVNVARTGFAAGVVYLSVFCKKFVLEKYTTPP